MPIFGHHGAGPLQVREGGTGVAAIQVWHNGFLVFDGTLAALVVGNAAVVSVIGGDGTVRSGVTIAGVTGAVSVIPGDGVAGGGVRVAGITGVVTVEGVAGSVAFGQTVIGIAEPQVITVAGGVGQATAAEPNEALGLSGVVTVNPIIGVAAGGQRAAGATGSIVVIGIAGTVRSGVTVAGTTGAVTVAGVAGTITAGARIAGTTGAITVNGIAGVASAGQTVIGSTGAITVNGVAGTASALTYPVRVPGAGGSAHGMRGNTNGAYSVTYPTDSVSGDLIALYVAAYRNDATASTLPVSGGATWNTKFVDNQLGSGNYAACYWTFRGAETGVTITPSSTIATAGHLWSIEVQMVAYEGASVDATDPVPQHSFFTEPASGSTATVVPAVITTGPYVELLEFYSAVRGGSTTAFTNIWSGATELTDLGGSMVSPANYMGITTAYDRQLTAGSTGTNTATPSVAVLFRRVTMLAIAPAGTPAPATPATISTDFGSTAGALGSNWSTFGATPPLYIDASGYASGVGTKSTVMTRAKWFQDLPIAGTDYEVWAIIADAGQLHSSSAVCGRISSDNLYLVEFVVTSTLVGINSVYNGTERLVASPVEGTGYKVRSPYGSAAPYGGGAGSSPYPELGAALVVGARIALRCIGTTYYGYIDPPGSTKASNLFVSKTISDIALSKRPGMLMQDDNPSTTSEPGGTPSYAGGSPPRFSNWGVIEL